MSTRAGQQFAAGAGVSTVLADADFETYSEAGFQFDYEENKWYELDGLSNQKRGIKGVGLYNYVRHPSFEVLSIAYDLKDGTGPRFWRPGLPDPVDLFEHVRAGKLLEAWGMEFEFEVWNEYCVKKLGWPPLHELQVRCAMAKSRQQSYPGALAHAGPALKLPATLHKDDAGEKLIKKLTVPKNPSKKNPEYRWTRATAPEDFARFDAYNVQDIVTESAASIRIKDLSERELAIWRVDQRINRRGMMIDVRGNDNCISIIEQCREKHNAEIRYITNGAVSGYTKAADMMAWFKTQGVYLYELDEDSVEEALERELPDSVRRVLRLRQILSFGSVNKCYAIRAQVCSDGRLRGQYIYHGAHTSLWNGQFVQPANLYKATEEWAKTPDGIEAALAAIASGSLEYVEALYGNGLETVANCLRSLIIAPEGYDLISADYTAIQAVVTAALAGEDWRLEVFHTHGKIYEMCAASITGRPFQFYLDYKKQTGKHHEDRQPYGKIPELSAGFGSWIHGWKKFGAGDFMNDYEIKQAILKWRAASPMIVELWGGQTRNKFQYDERPDLYGLEGAAIRAIKEPGKCFEYRGTRYQVHNGDLYCQPPTDGDPIIYHEIDLAPSTRDYSRPWEYEMTYKGWNSNQTKGKGGWVRMKLYGGVQTQNVVAKVSREVQANALMALEHSGTYVPVMHTHDEQVAEVRKGIGSTDEYLSLVNPLPGWAVMRSGRYAGVPWPIKAPAAERTPRYGKWE